MAVSSSVVSVSIVLSTRAPQAANFGIPALFGKTPFVGNRLYELSPEGLASMVTDGFTVNDRLYLMASTMSSQQPHTNQVLVCKRATGLTTNVLNFTPLVTTIGAVYTFDLVYKNVRSSFSYTVVTGTVDAICDDLKTLINASAAGVAGIAALGDVDPGTATKLILTGGTTGEPVQVSGLNPAMAKILDVSTDPGIATDLAAVTITNEFYGFCIDSYSEAENNAAAAWAEANGKLFIAQSADSTNVLDSAGTGVGHDFLIALYNRSTVAHNGDMPKNMGASILARQLSQDPGTSSWAFKTLAGPAADALTTTQIANAKGKNLLIYALNGGESETWFGKAASGRSLRIQQAIDLLQARVSEACHAVFLSNEYIPMSDKGFAQMQAAVAGVLMSFFRQGISDGPGTVTVPKKADVSSADLIAGKLPRLRFSVVIPNDMLSVEISGAVSF